MSGRVLSCIGNQAVVDISSSSIPKISSNVSISGKKIGRVFDVIGHVEKPYVVVKLSPKLNQDLTGSTVSWNE